MPGDLATIVSRAELEKHNSEGDGWVAINGIVYDLSKFYALHPGGERVLRKVYGGDATEAFYGLHRHENILKFGPRLLVGTLEGGGHQEIETQAVLSSVPYAEAPAYRNEPSAYETEGHVEFRANVRKFLCETVLEEALASEKSGSPPSEEVFRAYVQSGIQAGRIGPGPHLKYAPAMFGVDVKDFDMFHERILHEECARLSTPGYIDGLGSGLIIGLPPVAQAINDVKLKDRILRECLTTGESRICLAITEPEHGSDVAAIETTAVLSADKTHFVVNGQKKWITGGCESKYFSCAVRTGGKGMGGISMLLIERSEGVSTKRIKTVYSPAAGTALVEFDNVKVPVGNLIGEIDQGFLVIMLNFNHERWYICCLMLAGMRGVVEETIKWVNQRKAFGKKLIQNPAVQADIGHVVACVESTSAWLDQITYQMHTMSQQEQAMRLPGAVALLKYQTTRMAREVADRCTNLFGGRALTQSGMGRAVETFNRTFKLGATLGGSEPVMLSLGVSQLEKMYPRNAKL